MKVLFLCDRKSCEKCIMSRCDDFDGPEHCKSIYTDNPECAKNFYLEERYVNEFGERHYVEKYRMSEDMENSNVDLSALVIATFALIIAIAGLVIRFI